MELVFIGNELLGGRVVNSNGVFLVRNCEKKGFLISRHTILGDHEQEIKSGLKEALKRSHLVIASGGLGPTLDDLTKEAVAELFGLPLVTSSIVKEDLQKRFVSLPSLEQQSLIPEGATVFLNPVGTAPGLALTSSLGTVILLPGVPLEMEELFSVQILPFLEKKFPPRGKGFSRFCKTYARE